MKWVSSNIGKKAINDAKICYGDRSGDDERSGAATFIIIGFLDASQGSKSKIWSKLANSTPLSRV